MFLDLKIQLANRATRLANKILEAFASDVRDANQGNTPLLCPVFLHPSSLLTQSLGMSLRYEAMLRAIVSQPRTPEEWNEACTYLNVCENETSDLLALFERTKTIWEVSFLFIHFNCHLAFIFDVFADIRGVFVPSFAARF